MATTPETCSLAPFLAKAVPSRASPEQAASAMQIIIKGLENWLRRFKEAVCTDLQNVTPPSGVTEFTELTDAPHSYAGAAGDVVRVNATETGLEFFALSLVTAFLQLSDAPHSYAGEAHKFVRVNAGETALEFFDLIPTLVTAFIQLSDVPNSYSGAALKALRVNAGANAVEFFVQALTLLSDFPASYSGAGLKALRVNTGATAVEFFTQLFTLLGDVPTSYSGAAGKVVAVNAGASGLEFVDVTVTDIQSIPSLSRVIAAWTSNNSTGFSAYGLIAPAATRGTGGILRPTSGAGVIFARYRFSFASISGTNRYGGFNDTTGGGEVFRGNGTGEGGFRMTAVLCPGLTSVLANQRGFFGMQKALTAAPTDGTTTTAPSAYTDCVFVGYDGGDAHLQVMHNDNAGTCTKVDLGAGFPVDTTSMYRIRLFCQPNDTKITYEVVNCGSGAVASGDLTTNLPTNTQTLQPWFYVSSGTTNGSAGWNFVSFVLEAYAY